MRTRVLATALALFLSPSFLAAQVPGVPERPLPDKPFVIDTAEAGPVRVTPLKGLELPWDLAFLPNGDMLVTERTAMRLRLVRKGVLEPTPIAGLPEGMSAGGGGGLGGAGGAIGALSTKSSSRPLSRTSTEPSAISAVISAAAWEIASIRASRAAGSSARVSRSAAVLTSGPPASAAALRSRRRLSTYGVMSMRTTMTSL